MYNAGIKSYFASGKKYIYDASNDAYRREERAKNNDAWQKVFKKKKNL